MMSAVFFQNMWIPFFMFYSKKHLNIIRIHKFQFHGILQKVYWII